MNKFTVIVGQSASGKTTFVEKEFIKENKLTLIEEPLLHTVFDKTCLIGDYTTELRTKGTDRLSYSILPVLIDFIKKEKDKYDHFIAEGDRINSEKFFNFLKTLDVPVILHVFICDISLSVKRRQECGSNPSEQFVQATQTKSLHARDICRNLGFEVIVKDERTKTHGFW